MHENVDAVNLNVSGEPEQWEGLEWGKGGGKNGRGEGGTILDFTDSFYFIC